MGLKPWKPRSVLVKSVYGGTSFTFGNLTHTYDGSVKTATVIPSPSGASYTASLSRGPDAGTYTVPATATPPFFGGGSATLTIQPRTVATTITVDPISGQFTGTEERNLAVSATIGGISAPSSGDVTFTLRNGQGDALASVTAPVSSGIATATIAVPSNLPIGTGYRVTASFTGGTSTNENWTTSSADGGPFNVYPEPPISQGLRAWYRTDFGITKDASDRVSGWLDASTQGFDLLQSTASDRPLWVDAAINNRPIVNFENGARLNEAASRREGVR